MTEEQKIVKKTTEKINLHAELIETGVEQVLLELDNTLIGLSPVKTRIRETAALLLVEKAREKLGLVHETPTLHMSFSGNPGTGKTTVIECASTLLANSYGYHTSKTYSAGEQYLTNLGSSADPRNFFGDNSSSDNIYQPLIFEKGMYYDINYNQKSYADTAGVWENWRFTSWSHPPLDASSNYNYSGDFSWERGSDAMAQVEDESGNVLGRVNTIQNANTHAINASFNMAKFYRNLGLEKKKKQELLAKQKANEKKITKIYFDRGVYKYHGRIKIFAETLRKNGMEF